MEKLTTYTVFSKAGQEIMNLALPPNVDEDYVLSALLASHVLEGTLNSYTVEKELDGTFVICDIIGNITLYLREAAGTAFINT